MILGIRWAFFEPYVIPSGSMIPSLLIHDHILVNKFSYGIHFPFSTSWLMRFSTPRRGDVVVFRSLDDGGVFVVKRVIGLPGDEIKFAARGQLEINGKLVPQRELTPKEVATVTQHWINEDRDEYLEFYDFFEEDLEGNRHVVLKQKESPERASEPYRVQDNELFMMGDNRDNSSDSRVWGALPIDRVLGRAAAIWMSCDETLPDASQLCNPQTMRWYRMFRGI
jgi:signal peptidase I